MTMSAENFDTIDDPFPHSTRISRVVESVFASDSSRYSYVEGSCDEEIELGPEDMVEEDLDEAILDEMNEVTLIMSVRQSRALLAEVARQIDEEWREAEILNRPTLRSIEAATKK